MLNQIECPKKRTQIIKGVTYVYEDYPYWDKQRKQNRHRRVYVGKLGNDGNFIPNRKYLDRHDAAKGERSAVVPPKTATRKYFGAVHLLNEISKITGIEADLKVCFPHTYRVVMSLVYYLVLESESPMYRFSRWTYDHWHPANENLSSQRISELMRNISEDAKLKFCKNQSKRRQESEYLAYDTTSVSSLSEYIKAAKYGKNKDGEPLPQVNLALVFGEESGMPVYYRVLPGNIQDVTTIKKLLKDVEFLEIKKLKLVMDRGFYSAKNINALYKGNYKFLISVKLGIKFISNLLEAKRESIKSFNNYDEEHEIYTSHSTEKWKYLETDKKGNILKEETRKIYVHLYYNGMRAEEEKTRFIKALRKAEIALKESEDDSERHNTLVEQYFDVKRTPEQGIQITYREEAIAQRLMEFGYFALLSNEISESRKAIETYRKKDMVEKAFDNLKEKLEMKRTRVHSDATLAGKFFLQFIALMYVSYIHKYMKQNNLYQNYTMQSLLDTLDVIERYEYEGHKYHCGEITEKQRELYAFFNAQIPNTL
ncbi:MAG: IS1634 family transposase [Holosporaceae bacterium]|jgi:transposase|nr:IS1634 family transposase [Holosporaceae bacterium]